MENREPSETITPTTNTPHTATHITPTGCVPPNDSPSIPLISLQFNISP